MTDKSGYVQTMEKIERTTNRKDKEDALLTYVLDVRERWAKNPYTKGFSIPSHTVEQAAFSTASQDTCGGYFKLAIALGEALVKGEDMRDAYDEFTEFIKKYMAENNMEVMGDINSGTTINWLADKIMMVYASYDVGEQKLTEKQETITKEFYTSLETVTRMEIFKEGDGIKAATFHVMRNVGLLTLLDKIGHPQWDRLEPIVKEYMAIIKPYTNEGMEEYMKKLPFDIGNDNEVLRNFIAVQLGVFYLTNIGKIEPERLEAFSTEVSEVIDVLSEYSDDANNFIAGMLGGDED